MLHLVPRSASIRLVITVLALVSAAIWFSLRTHSLVAAAGATSDRDPGSVGASYTDLTKPEGPFLDRFAAFSRSHGAFVDMVLGRSAIAAITSDTLSVEPSNPLPAPAPSAPIVTFVIGDGNATIGSNVLFWGNDWTSRNSVSGGAPSSFKGYANVTKPNPPTCGGTWTSNNSSPPSSVPSTVVIIVASKITKSGSSFSGDIKEMVIVQTNSGYQGNLDHPGTGKVVGVYCAQCI